MRHWHADLQRAVEACGSAAGGGKPLFCGNGGSAADAALGRRTGQLVLLRPARAGGDRADHRHQHPTAVGNDYGYDYTFARQVEALGSAGDVLVAISTSGNSPNVLRAAEAARRAACACSPSLVATAGAGPAG